MTGPHPSPLIRLACRYAARLIQVFAMYVIFHGHYSPGGGFQGGALLAAAVILMRIGEGKAGSQRELPSDRALLVGSIGVLIFAGVGLIDMLLGGRFLQYDYTPLPGLSIPYLHYWSILIIEIGVGLAVMAVLVAIFDRLFERSLDD